MKTLHFVGDPESFEVTRERLMHGDRLTDRLLREDILGDLVLIVCDDLARSLDDGLRGAVVALELEGAGVGEGLLEAEDIVQVRPAEGVDTLGIIADDEDSTLILHQLAGDHVLGEVGILILVDEEVVDAVLPELQYIGVLAEEDIDLQQEVIEVHRIGALELSLVVLVDLVELRQATLRIVLEEVSVGGVGTGGDEAVLRRGDAVVHDIGLVDLVVETELLDDGLDTATAVGGVVDRVV